MAKKAAPPVKTKRQSKFYFVLIEYNLSGQRTYVPAEMVPKLLKAGCRLVDQMM
jgi:hypothetical protein